MNAPPNQMPVQDKNGQIENNWQIYFSDVYRAITATQSSGTTAKRPNKGLFIGRQFFDTSLGIPIYYNGTDWVNSVGATV